jgi:PKD repeat protein
VTLTVTDDGLLSCDAAAYAYINDYPVADVGGPYQGTVGEIITFDGTGSSDTDGDIVSWQWNFGDDHTGSGETTTHSYSSSGTYTVTLTVTDNNGATDDDTTMAYINSPPDSPSDPVPGDGAVDVETNVILEWTCSDPDDDELTFDVYFGSMLPIVKIASNITNPSCNPGVLYYDLTHYWNVVAWDEHGASTSGPPWSFTTKNEPIYVPDLKCDGELVWNNVKGSSTVVGSFTVSNGGQEGSELSWQIASFPEWGNWTITPNQGSGLKPSDEPIIVSVSVVAPESNTYGYIKNDDYSGEVKIVNSHDTDDFEIIQVSMNVAKNKAFTGFDRLFENHIILYTLFKILIGGIFYD